MSQIVVTQNDYGISIQTTFTKDGETFDITGKTIVLDIVKPDQSIVSNKAPMISNPTGGVVALILSSDITDVVGTYILYYSVKDGSTSITAQSPVTYTVIAKDGGVSAV